MRPSPAILLVLLLAHMPGAGAAGPWLRYDAFAGGGCCRTEAGSGDGVASLPGNQHRLSLVPNTRIRSSGADALARGGTRFTVGENFDRQAQPRRSDVILYYSILDNLASVDVGVDARYIDGTETAQPHGWLPLLHAGVGFTLPSSGLSLGAGGAYLDHQGQPLYDITLHASYSASRLLEAGLGYRHRKLGRDSDPAHSADAVFSGPYAGIFIGF